MYKQDDKSSLNLSFKYKIVIRNNCSDIIDFPFSFFPPLNTQTVYLPTDTYKQHCTVRRTSSAQKMSRSKDPNEAAEAKVSEIQMFPYQTHGEQQLKNNNNNNNKIT